MSQNNKEEQLPGERCAYCEHTPVAMVEVSFNEYQIALVPLCNDHKAMTEVAVEEYEQEMRVYNIKC